MRQIHPTYVEHVSATELHDAYRYPGHGVRVRANMVASVDGSAVRGGRSGGLSSEADTAVFALLRALADVVLVGAGTARIEGYRALRPKEAYADARRDRGQRPAPVLAVVSGRLDLDPKSDLFHGGADRTIVITHQASNARTRDRLAEVADVLLAGVDQVDLGRALNLLTERGLNRVLCEGGPSLLADLTAAERLDELCLTISPQLVGGAGRRILSSPLELHTQLRLAHLLEDNGVLLGRWTVG